jgi:homoaconitase/3-isopropylmalate dehydratase large subunit
LFGALLAIAAGLGLSYLYDFFKKKRFQKNFSHSERFNINGSLYGYITETDIVLVASSLSQEILRFRRDSLTRVEFGSEEDKIERKSAEVVVIEWSPPTGTSRVFKLDISEPNSNQKAMRLLEKLQVASKTP